MTVDTVLDRLRVDEDSAALLAACEPGTGLCTLVGIEGSFSRRRGAQLAVKADGSTVGSLSDGCLESQIAADVRGLDRPEVRRYGRGSGNIDVRLPCGSGLDILLDPCPDRQACRVAIGTLGEREIVRLALPAPSPMRARTYVPRLAIRAFGEGPELASFAALCRAADIAVDAVARDSLALGRPSGLQPADRWTAVVLLFHDHEWEAPLIAEALASDAFYVGAQGGENARNARTMALYARGVAEEDIARLRSPIGLVPACRTPATLALSVLTEIVERYESRRDAA